MLLRDLHCRLFIKLHHTTLRLKQIDSGFVISIETVIMFLTAMKFGLTLCQLQPTSPLLVRTSSFFRRKFLHQFTVSGVLSKTWMAFCKRLWAKRGRHFLAYYVVEKCMAEGQVVWWKICRVFATRLNAFENGDYYYKDSFFYFTILSVVHRLPKVNLMDFIYKAKKGYATASHNSPLCLVRKRIEALRNIAAVSVLRAFQ